MNDLGNECPFRRHSRETLEAAMDLIAARAEKGGSPVAGIPTGLIDLDDVTGGLQPGQLIVVGGRPSMGKTALALGMCAHAAFEQGAHVLYFSLELARHEVGERLLCARSGIDGYRLRTGMGLGNGAMAALAKAFNGMSRAKGWLYIHDAPGRNALQVAEQARRIKGEYPVGLVAIDYVSLLGDDGASEGQ
jgi:replicative DNA helicase